MHADEQVTGARHTVLLDSPCS